MRGLFIVFEGIDGAGLTTQAKLLERYLRKKGYNVILTKEPTDSLIGGLIRAALRCEWKTDPVTLQLLFAADRSHHVTHYILPSLRNGKIVISDRYLFSSLAYGSIDCDYDWLLTINKHFPLPDLTIVLDVPAQIAINRIAESRFGFELFENIEKLEQVRRNYHKIVREFDNMIIVDGTKSIEEVHREIVKQVEKLLTSG